MILVVEVWAGLLMVDPCYVDPCLVGSLALSILANVVSSYSNLRDCVETGLAPYRETRRAPSLRKIRCATTATGSRLRKRPKVRTDQPSRAGFVETPADRQIYR